MGAYIDLWVVHGKSSPHCGRVYGATTYYISHSIVGCRTSVLLEGVATIKYKKYIKRRKSKPHVLYTYVFLLYNNNNNEKRSSKFH